MNNPFQASQIAQFMQDYSAAEIKQVEKFETKTALQDLLYQLKQSGLKPYDKGLMLKAYRFINQHLSNIKTDYSIDSDQGYDQKKLQDLNIITIPALEKAVQQQENLYSCLHQTASLHLNPASWLENVFQISCSQSTLALKVLELYLHLNQKTKDLPALYQSLLLQTRGENDQHTELSGDNTSVLELTIIQLALARFPRVFFAEILGFTLAYCQSASIVEICFPQHQLQTDYFTLRNNCLKQQIPLVHNIIHTYLQCFPSQQQTLLWQRLQTGFWLYQQKINCCRDDFDRAYKRSISTDQAVINLLQEKVAAAIGHHQSIVLKGKSLDSWFSDFSANPLAFLQLLKQSDYIDQQTPANSRLLTLFEFKGPMFGVLDKQELELIKLWLQNTKVDNSVKAGPKQGEINLKLSKKAIRLKKYQGLSNRELYFYLLNVDLFPDVLPTAEVKVRHLLRFCRMFSRMPFKQYSDEKFNHFIAAVYQQEMKAYQPLQGKPKISKAAYVWGIKQIAPMILIDGCWLQHSLALKSSYPEIAELLFSIYCDESGQGQLQQNHPYIFKQLLDSLSINYPAAHSTEFNTQAGLIDSSFDLPVYMLALSQFPVQFLPELLGLNMAIELSGLGKGYMTLVDEWRYWGIDPSIAEIHISIDNIASGHTFLAKKTIQLYMDKLMQETADQVVLNQHWQRIYTGYASLRLVSTRFKLCLPISYLFNK